MQKNYTDIIAEAKNAIENRKTRSAWDEGVTVYAMELLESLEWHVNDIERAPRNAAECEEWMLNGADNWSQYSWNGCALCYDSDIAQRLCCPSELRKTRNGQRKPNAREEWLDVQARALYQACRLLTREVLSRA